MPVGGSLTCQRASLHHKLTALPTHTRATHSHTTTNCDRYLRLITPSLYMGALVECLKRYLLAQRVVVPGVFVTATTCLLSPLYNWVMMFK